MDAYKKTAGKPPLKQIKKKRFSLRIKELMESE